MMTVEKVTARAGTLLGTVRLKTSRSATPSALTNASTAADETPLASGWATRRAPAKPTAINAMRRGPIFSRQIDATSTIRSSGAVCTIAMTSAIGMTDSATI
jgi:hypothetical protein